MLPREVNIFQIFIIKIGCLENLKWLSKIKADFHAVDLKGQSVLHYAVKGHHNQCIVYLLSLRLNPYAISDKEMLDLRIEYNTRRLIQSGKLLKRVLIMASDIQKERREVMFNRGIECIKMFVSPNFIQTKLGSKNNNRRSGFRIR